uniref:Uncharacterized protein n=1 Tax=Macrostomum lignano TaxID=282301 RepID=A0A1I8FEH9_9PLAT
MDEEKRKELENKAIDLMRNVAQRKEPLREGDGRLGSIDRLMPDFYAIFSSNSRLAYMQQWSTFETIMIVVPMAVLLLAALISISSKLAQIASTCSCRSPSAARTHLAARRSPVAADGIRRQRQQRRQWRELPRPLRMIRWLDDKGVASAWGPEKRRSILKEGPLDHR